MKNRAKCKLCNSIIESFHPTDLVSCKCGEILVDGGDAMKCAANDWDNFLRVDDEGNEIIVTVKDSGRKIYTKEEENIIVREAIDKVKFNKDELLDMLNRLCEDIENLPQQAMQAPVTNSDLHAVLLLINSLFRAKD